MKMYDEVRNIEKKIKKSEIKMPLSILELYVNGAIFEWERIQVTKNALLQSKSVEKITFDSLFHDVHFFFICCEKVQNLIEYLADIQCDQRLKDLWIELKPLFKPYNDIRNHLEHLHTRLKPEFLRNFCNIENDEFKFGTDQCDISEKSLRFITESYDKVIEVVKLIYNIQ